MHTLTVRFITLAILLYGSLTLSGCGQKGDLYHPDEESAAIATATHVV